MRSSLQNPFVDEWRECLIAYYRHILQRQEHSVEVTLRQLLLSVGIPEERLIALGAPAPELADETPAPVSTAAAPEPEQAPDAQQPSVPEQPSEPSAQAPSAESAKREKKPPKQLSFF